MKIFFLLAFVVSNATAASWYVANKEGDSDLKGEHSLTLKSGWKCDISKATTLNSRETVCTKDSEEIRFSVMCDSNRKQDHTQIRFKSKKSKDTQDYVEVGCKL